jgi:hypothetical protein
MTDLQITTLVPQTSDNERMLLARILSYQQRASIRGTLLASAARTATTSTSETNGSNYRGVMLFLNVTSASGTGGLTLFIEHLDPVSNLWAVTAVQSAAAITTTGLRPYLIGSGVAVGTNMGAAGSPVFADRGHLLTSAFRVRINHGDATSYTYSVGYELIP